MPSQICFRPASKHQDNRPSLHSQEKEVEEEACARIKTRARTKTHAKVGEKVQAKGVGADSTAHTRSKGLKAHPKAQAHRPPAIDTMKANASTRTASTNMSVRLATGSIQTPGCRRTFTGQKYSDTPSHAALAKLCSSGGCGGQVRASVRRNL